MGKNEESDYWKGRRQVRLAIPVGTSAFLEVNKLARFLLDNYDEVETMNEGESAVDIAILLIQRLEERLEATASRTLKPGGSQ